VFKLPDGSKVEVFGSDSPIDRHFTTGPVAGFLVDDVQGAAAELRSAGVEILLESESDVDANGNAWVRFRAPDGTTSMSSLKFRECRGQAESASRRRAGRPDRSRRASLTGGRERRGAAGSPVAARLVSRWIAGGPAAPGERECGVARWLAGRMRGGRRVGGCRVVLVGGDVVGEVGGVVVDEAEQR
jgi:hypothetical protein